MRVLTALLDNIERYMIILCMLLIVVLVFLGVLSRFIFHYSIAWSEELVRYLFIWGGLFGAAAGFRYGKHSGVPLIVEKLSPRMQRLSAWSVVIGSVGYCGFMALQAYRGTLRAMGTGQISSGTGIPVWTVNLLMALAFTWCAIRAAQYFFAPPQSKSELEEELDAQNAANSDK